MVVRKMMIVFVILLMGFIVPASAAEIHSAAKKGDFDTVKQLLQKDPKLLDVGNRVGQTPLLLASYSGHQDIILFLIDKGAKIDQPDDFGATPLHMAVLGGQKEIVELLIQKGAKVNAKSKNGKIPLQMAFEKDDPEIVEVFIKHGAAINTGINEYGRSMLHEAIIMGKPKIINFLIEKGAPIDFKDKTGKTPLDLALICEHKNVAQLLMDKGAKPTETPAVEVTYIANAGFLIVGKEQKVLIDALFQSGFEKYAAPSDNTLEDMIKAKPPFDNINLLMFTFKQAAHFEPILAENFLLNNPQAALLSSKQVALDLELYGSQFQKIKDQVMGITVSPPMKSVASVTAKGIKMKILRLNFAEEYQAMGYVMDIGGKTLCFMGDAILKNSEDYIKRLLLNKQGIDVLFITYWDFLNTEARTIIDQYIQPKHIAVMHIPPAEAENISKDIEKLGSEYPNLTIFKDFMQKKVF